MVAGKAFRHVVWMVVDAMDGNGGILIKISYSSAGVLRAEADNLLVALILPMVSCVFYMLHNDA